MMAWRPDARSLVLAPPSTSSPAGGLAARGGARPRRLRVASEVGGGIEERRLRRKRSLDDVDLMHLEAELLQSGGGGDGATVSIPAHQRQPASGPPSPETKRRAEAFALRLEAPERNQLTLAAPAGGSCSLSASMEQLDGEALLSQEC